MIAAMLSLGIVAGALTGAPEVTGVLPDPLPRGASAEATGAGFVAGDTTIDIGGVAQAVGSTQATAVRFTVAAATPLGAQTLTVTVAGESATRPVTVVPPAPTIELVVPDPLVLGGRATIQGTALDGVTDVELDGHACTIVEQSATVLAFDVPFEASLLGTALLEVASPDGGDAVNVDIVAPLPRVDTLTPNPARAGDLVAIGGRILPLAPEVRLGADALTVVTRTTDALTVWLPTTLAPGPRDLVVVAAGLTSAPAGPLLVQAAASDAPSVRAVYPARVAAGGALWVIGDHLAGIDRALPGLALEACDRRACRVSTAGLAAGAPFQAALAGPSGAAVFPVELVAEAPAEPVVSRVEPSPARRGEALTIYASRVASVRSVVLGGQVQVIDFFDEEKIVVTVHEATPLGSETLFLASNVGSPGFAVDVLEPLPADPGPEPTPDADAESGAEGDVAAEKKDDDDCAAGGGAGALLGLAALLARRARSGPQRLRPS